MSKILNSVLDMVSENNNEYRGILRTLNSNIDERTSTLVGDVVTMSGYTIDFSSALTGSKERLVNPISRIIESYVIRDLRSVETVNEQFVEKINDKLENANITSKEEKEAFSANLNNLLNEKYLEIVKIKRVDFFTNNQNEDIEKIMSDFLAHLRENAVFDEDALTKVLDDYKEEIYSLVAKALKKISSLYLNNFVNEISSALNQAIDYDDNVIVNNDVQDFKPFVPEINPIPAVEIPSVPTEPVTSDLESTNIISSEPLDIPFIPNISDNEINLDIPSVIEPEEVSTTEENVEVPEIPQISFDNETVASPMEVEPIAPIEIKEEPKEPIKRSYDVEEILKIAKSPIVTMPVAPKEDSYVNVEPIVDEKENDIVDSLFDEREVVEEMIRRLTKRLELIDERRAKYDEEYARLEEDEAFVNDLIESSKTKKQELDSFEQELDNKEKELDEKQKELDKKINDVMPFANAVLNTEKES